MAQLHIAKKNVAGQAAVLRTFHRRICEINAAPEHACMRRKPEAVSHNCLGSVPAGAVIQEPSVRASWCGAVPCAAFVDLQQAQAALIAPAGRGDVSGEPGKDRRVRILAMAKLSDDAAPVTGAALAKP